MNEFKLRQGLWRENDREIKIEKDKNMTRGATQQFVILQWLILLREARNSVEYTPLLYNWWSYVLLSTKRQSISDLGFISNILWHYL